MMSPLPRLKRQLRCEWTGPAVPPIIFSIWDNSNPETQKLFSGQTTMSRTEQDREDLLREATALIERVELRVSGWSESVVAGFRRGGQASFFFGADLVYQFNAALQLRRGFHNGQLIKAEDGRLERHHALHRRVIRWAEDSQIGQFWARPFESAKQLWFSQ